MNNSSTGIQQISFIQHNTGKRDIAHYTILQQAYEAKVDIVLLQEPYSPRGPQGFIGLSHPAYHLVLPQPSQGPSQIQVKPRVLTYIRKALQLAYTPRYDLQQDPDIQILQIFLDSEPFFIINIYNERERLPENQQGQYTVERALQLIQLQGPILLIGDFNLHHPWWNSRVTEASKISKASTLIKWLERNRASLLNNPLITNKGGTLIRENLRYESIIDLTFYTPFKKLSFNNWHYTKATGSDHEAIAFTAALPKPLPTISLQQAPFNLKLANWDLFQQLLQASEKQALQDIEWALDFEDLDTIAEILTTIITRAASIAIPKLQLVERSKPWWDPGLKDLRQQMHQALRQYKQTRQPASKDTWKAARNTYFTAVKTAKATYWENFLTEAQGPEVFTAYKYTKPAIFNTIPSLKYNQGTANTFQEKCSAFLTTLFPIATVATAITATATTATTTATTATATTATVATKWPWPALTTEEISRAIFSSAPKKAPGPDLLTFGIVQKAYKAIPTIFSKAYTALFNIGYQPIAWREAVGVILPKQGNRDYSLPKSYRIIALLNCLGKILEKLFATRLSYIANTPTYNLLHSTQLGGRKQRSAVDTVLLLLHYIQQQRAQAKNQYTRQKLVTTTLFLDIKGAFDHVSKPRLLQILQDLQLPRALVSWVDSFMTNRKIQLAFTGQRSEKAPVNIGIPQGSPISPILFLIYVRGVLAKQGLQLSYIDDFSISVTSTRPDRNCRALEAIVRDLESEVQGHAQFDPTKTELIHFSTTRQPIQETVTVFGTVIQPKPVVKWLGIYLDYRLTFKPHVQKRIQLATAVLYNLQRLSSTLSKLSFRALRQLYQSAVVTIADYGLQLWWGSKGSKSLSTYYTKLQNRALPTILGAFRGSPLRALEIEAALPPAHIRHLGLINNLGLRILQFQHNHPIIKALQSPIRDELASSESDQPAIRAYLQPTTQLLRLGCRLRAIVGKKQGIQATKSRWEEPWALGPQATIRISNSNKKTATKEHHNLLQKILATGYANNSIALLYTDGSLGEGIGAAAVCRIGSQQEPLLARSWNLGPNLEVADCESIAIIQALEIALANRGITICYIFIDSQAAITRLQGYNPFALQAKGLLAQLAVQGKKTYIQWCPAHTGITGNELADTLAKAALKKPPKGPLITTLGNLRRSCKVAKREAWKAYWEGLDIRKGGKGILYQKITQDSLTFSLQPGIPRCPRPLQSAYIQLKVGIGYLKPHLKNIRKATTDLCIACKAKETTAHLLLRCKQYKAERKELAQALQGLPLNLQALFNTTVGRQGLLQYIRATGICTGPWATREGYKA